MSSRPRADRASRPSRNKRGRTCARLGAIASAAFVAALFLAQAGQLFHLLLVPHRICEHGQLIHVHASPNARNARDARNARNAPTSPPKSEAPSNRAPVLAQGSRESGVAPASPLDGEEHGHCDVNGVRSRVAEPTPRIGQATLLGVVDDVTLRASSERRPVAPLDLAPKSSPPSC